MPGGSIVKFIDKSLTLFRGYGLKGGDLLLDSGALAFGAPEFFLFVFRDRDSKGKGFIALFTLELVYWHTNPPDYM